MDKWKMYIDECMKRDWSLFEKVLFASTCFLMGILIGFLFSPIKKGIYREWSICSNNGSENGSNNNSITKQNKK